MCLDLNVWCANYLAVQRGRSGTAAQLLVDAVRRGHCSLGATQLVISWGMLNRLRKVWEDDWRISPDESGPLLSTIAQVAMRGPLATDPYLLLGGTGIVPLRDAEDAHVLEVAIAGRADLLVTTNFRDFISYRTEIIDPGQLAIHATSDTRVLIAHPFIAAEWIRKGEIVIP